MDAWQRGEGRNSDENSGIETALLNIRPATALAILVVVSCVILLSGMYLPGPWLDTTGFRVLMQVSFKLAVALWIQADARSRGWPTSRSTFYVCFALIAVLIAYPVYLVMSRGWRGALATGVRGMGVLLLLVMAVAAVSLTLESVWGMI